MKLNEWLEYNGETMASFAEKIKTTQSAVSRYARGGQIPGREIMVRIVRETLGEVGPADFYDLPSEFVTALPGVRIRVSFTGADFIETTAQAA